MTKEKLFVYGTLRKGFPLHRYVSNGARFIGTGTIRGMLYDLGAYPGVYASDEGEVKGELYELQNGSVHLKELDRIEDYYPDDPEHSLFIRVLTDVRLSDGSSIQAWVYLLPSIPANCRLIQGGDYGTSR
jgi:gamma-glutamylcyclotransferase (GGCT)/AIG2-like uncharacterized protein YtfP